jgi:hypothetical protein
MNYIKSIYKYYIQDIVSFYFPNELSLIFDRNKKRFISKYCYCYNNYEYLYKINYVDYNNKKFYNFGYKYTNSSNKENHIIASTTENIDSIIVYLDNNELIIISDDPRKQDLVDLKEDNSIKFINSILNFSSETVKLDILLYYYLQIILKNNNIINNVYFKIDNTYHKINFEDNLKNIYNKLELS